MVPLTPASNPRQRAAHEPLYDIHPRSGISIEVFYADRGLESSGREGAGWFWWPGGEGSHLLDRRLVRLLRAMVRTAPMVRR
jgi:hypothetical protein